MLQDELPPSKKHRTKKIYALIVAAEAALKARRLAVHEAAAIHAVLARRCALLERLAQDSSAVSVIQALALSVGPAPAPRSPPPPTGLDVTLSSLVPIEALPPALEGYMGQADLVRRIAGMTVGDAMQVYRSWLARVQPLALLANCHGSALPKYNELITLTRAYLTFFALHNCVAANHYVGVQLFTTDLSTGQTTDVQDAWFARVADLLPLHMGLARLADVTMRLILRSFTDHTAVVEGVALMAKGGEHALHNLCAHEGWLDAGSRKLLRNWLFRAQLMGHVVAALFEMEDFPLHKLSLAMTSCWPFATHGSSVLQAYLNRPDVAAALAADAATEPPPRHDASLPSTSSVNVPAAGAAAAAATVGQSVAARARAPVVAAAEEEVPLQALPSQQASGSATATAAARVEPAQALPLRQGGYGDGGATAAAVGTMGMGEVVLSGLEAPRRESHSGAGSAAMQAVGVAPEGEQQQQQQQQRQLQLQPQQQQQQQYHQQAAQQQRGGDVEGLTAPAGDGHRGGGIAARSQGSHSQGTAAATDGLCRAMSVGRGGMHVMQPGVSTSMLGFDGPHVACGSRALFDQGQQALGGGCWGGLGGLGPGRATGGLGQLGLEASCWGGPGDAGAAVRASAPAAAPTAAAGAAASLQQCPSALLPLLCAAGGAAASGGPGPRQQPASGRGVSLQARLELPSAAAPGWARAMAPWDVRHAHAAAAAVGGTASLGREPYAAAAPSWSQAAAAPSAADGWQPLGWTAAAAYRTSTSALGFDLPGTVPGWAQDASQPCDPRSTAQAWAAVMAGGSGLVTTAASASSRLHPAVEAWPVGVSLTEDLPMQLQQALRPAWLSG